MIVSDNGAELKSNAILCWQQQRGVSRSQTVRMASWKTPMAARNDCLNEHLFTTAVSRATSSIS
jgi:hypothetical protein